MVAGDHQDNLDRGYAFLDFRDAFGAGAVSHSSQSFSNKTTGMAFV